MGYRSLKVSNQQQAILMKKSIMLLCSATLLATPLAHAGDSWKVNTALQGTYLGYSNSQYRNSLYEAGAVVSADYLDEGGVTLGYTHSGLTYKSNIPRLEQNAYFLSGRKHFYFDSVPGKITLRADGYIIDNNDPTNDTDNVRTFATQASFISHDKQYYTDFGYARSSYRNNLRVDQYTPTVGIALFDSAGWLQLRGYFIETSNPDRAQGLSSTQAAEIKYTHWLTPDGYLKPSNLQIGGMVGRRFYTVDLDAGSVANLADVQTGGITAGAEWKLGDHAKALLLGGNNFYKNRTAGDSYSGAFGYLNVSTTW
jgi:hypothetical protein